MLYVKSIFFFLRTWCSTWQWSDHLWVNCSWSFSCSNRNWPRNAWRKHFRSIFFLTNEWKPNWDIFSSMKIKSTKSDANDMNIWKVGVKRIESATQYLSLLQHKSATLSHVCSSCFLLQAQPFFGIEIVNITIKFNYISYVHLKIV
jgi:hypothetical protein